MPNWSLADRTPHILGSVLALVLALLALQPGRTQNPLSPERAEAKPGRPNIIVVMTDDQTVADMAALPRTRRLLGRGGVRFRNSFASYPVCCPSRATFLSGQYAHNHKVLGLYPPSGGYERFDKRENLAVWLERAGYRTAHVGKYLNGYGSRTPARVPPGWTDWHGAVDNSTYRMWGYTLNENGKLRTYGRFDERRPALYQTDLLRDKALRLIRGSADADKPLFLSLAFLAPHYEKRPRTGSSRNVRAAPRHRGRFGSLPLPHPRSFDEPDVSDKPSLIRRRPRLSAAARTQMTAEFRARRRSLLAVDEAVAAIVRELRRKGQLNNTYLLFTSDNGYMQGQHRVTSGKMLAYDPSTRVPLLLRGPGVPRDRRVVEPVANIDLAPTILELARASATKRLDGRSLLPFARRPGRRTRRPLLVETGGRRYISRADLDPGPVQKTKRLLSYKAVRTSRYLYVAWRNGEQELYDLRRDPAELHSLHAARRYAPVRRGLRRILERLRDCAGARCRAEPDRRLPRPG